jgi:hypothetical protein
MHIIITAGTGLGRLFYTGTRKNKMAMKYFANKPAKATISHLNILAGNFENANQYSLNSANS